MPRSKLKAKMEYVRSHRQSTQSPKKLDAIRFAFSILASGSSYQQGQLIMLWNDLLPPKEGTFYKAQRIVTAEIVAMARESCLKWRNKMAPDSCIAFDGSWSHRRNAQHCLVDFIDTSNDKVVDFEIITKKTCHGGDYEGASNGMECEGLRRIIPRWITNARVTSYVHDKDAKSRNVIAQLGWNVTEKLDTNHVMKSFRRKFQKHQKMSPTRLRGIKSRLERFFQSLLRLDEPIDVKTMLWENSVLHFSGDHSKCPMYGPSRRWADIDDRTNRDVLLRFIEKTKPLLEKSDGSHGTQMCESLHAVKVHFADKIRCWKTSWAARICAAILDVNDPGWMMSLYRKLGLPPLSPEIRERLVSIERAKQRDRIARRERDRQERERLRKKEARERLKHDDEKSEYKGVGKPARKPRSEGSYCEWITQKSPKLPKWGDWRQKLEEWSIIESDEEDENFEWCESYSYSESEGIEVLDPSDEGSSMQVGEIVDPTVQDEQEEEDPDEISDDIFGQIEADLDEILDPDE